MSAPRFSFVVPVYNEGAAFIQTVDRIWSQSFRNYELLVIEDAATAETSVTVERLSQRGRLRRIRHQHNRGAAATRNSGVAAASGEIVVFLDGDVEVPADFLAELDSEYLAGVDAVAVDSRVADLNRVVGRFQQAVHEFSYPNMRGTGFSQAFSCRRDVARAVRFREDIPGAGAEDGAFYLAMTAAGYSCRKRPNIVVEHRLPTSIKGLWRQAEKRGRAIPHADVKLHGKSTPAMVARRLAASVRAAVGIVVLVPGLRRAVALSRLSPQGLGDLLAFWLLHHIYLMGQRGGELSEALKIASRQTQP